MANKPRPDEPFIEHEILDYDDEECVYLVLDDNQLPEIVPFTTVSNINSLN